MKYIIYKITNKINGKIYIGKHQTIVIDDGYMGSGKYLKHAINKYGIQNFTKTVLHIFDTEQEMNDKEREIVTEEFCLREDTYNICVGGKGGFSYINSITRADPSSEMERERVKNIRNTHILKGIRPPKPVWTQEKRDRNGRLLSELIRTGKVNNYFINNNPMSNPDLKAKHKDRCKNNSKGDKNSQYGSFWITNGVENRKIRDVAHIPIGWYKGRIIKKGIL